MPKMDHDKLADGIAKKYGAAADEPREGDEPAGEKTAERGLGKTLKAALASDDDEAICEAVRAICNY